MTMMSDWKDWGGGVVVVIMSSISCSDWLFQFIDREIVQVLEALPHWMGYVLICVIREYFGMSGGIKSNHDLAH